MKFAVANEHINYFSRYGRIAFHDMLSLEALTFLKSEVAKLGDQTSPEALFQKGHDLYRLSPELKSLITKRNFGENVAALTNRTFVQIAYDQYLPSFQGGIYLPEEEGYLRYLKGTESLEERSSIHPLICGLILALDGRDELPSDEKEEGFILPSLEGEGMFFLPDLPLDLSLLLGKTKQRFLMIAYCSERAQYRTNELDPHTYHLKKQGYMIGDLLRSTDHPIVYRR